MARLSNSSVSMETPHFWPLLNWKLNSKSNKQLHLNFIFYMSSSVKFRKAEIGTWTTAKYIHFLFGWQEGSTSTQLCLRGWDTHLQKGQGWRQNMKQISVIVPTKNCIKILILNKILLLPTVDQCLFPSDFTTRVVRWEKDNCSSLVSYWSVAHFEARDLLLMSLSVQNHLQKGVCLLLASSLDFL